MNLILMGPPGVGKGTQGRVLSGRYNVPVISSGDMFRQVQDEDSDEARAIRDYMERGDYVPDELTINMVLNRLNAPDAICGFILDGFPRTVPQAEALDRHLADEGRRIDQVVLLQASAVVILSRLAGRRVCLNCGLSYNDATNPPKAPGVCNVCGGRVDVRLDEAPDVQRRRLEVYEQETAPVAAYYERTNRLKKVDATRSVADVQIDLLRILDEPTAGVPAGSRD